MTNTQCTQEGCQVSLSGKCLEGFDPIDTCPYMSNSLDGQEQSEGHTSLGNFVDLPSGDTLTEAQADAVTRDGISQVIIVAGPVKSGKTTILTALFEAFLEAPFGNYLFAGSRTLVGFEKRCHDARVSSERTVAATGHTSMQEGIRFLHLRLAIAKDNAPIRKHLLISDISGEIFTQLRDSTASVLEMSVLKRADHICIVIDGEKLADQEQRHVARNDSRAILRSIIDAGMLSSTCKIEVVFSKWDLVVGSKQPEDVIKYVDETREGMKNLLGPSSSLKFYEIAARPESRALPFAHGLPTLVRSWMEEPTTLQKPDLFLSSRNVDGREFARFGQSIAAAHRLEDAFNVRWV